MYALAHTRPRIATVEQPEMRKWQFILLLVHHPLFYLNQTIVGPFDILQHLLCAWISFALCALMRSEGIITYSGAAVNCLCSDQPLFSISCLHELG